ncbi:MAG: hypothetical protein HYR63_21205 [Proteobacteria bacterium]|nr:hypothetical protein [Pseudomonadota bacterium]
MTGRRNRIQVVCVSAIRKELLSVTGTAMPHPECDDPQSPAVGLWQFWIAGEGEPLLVAKRELVHLKSRRPLD